MPESVSSMMPSASFSRLPRIAFFVSVEVSRPIFENLFQGCNVFNGFLGMLIKNLRQVLGLVAAFFILVALLKGVFPPIDIFQFVYKEFVEF